MASSDSRYRLLNVRGRGLQNHLHLRVLVETIGILAVTSVGGAARWLVVRNLVFLRSEHAQESFRRHRARANFEIEGLLQHTAVGGPIGLQALDQFLVRQWSFGH